MHIEFALPKNELLTSLALDLLAQELELWAQTHNITILDHGKPKGWSSYQVLLSDQQHYTVFALTWNPTDSYWASNYSIV